MMLYILQSLRKRLLQFKSYRPDIISVIKISKGYNSIKNIGGVMLLNICTLSDYVLYLYQASRKISQMGSELLRRHNFHTKKFKGA